MTYLDPAQLDRAASKTAAMPDEIIQAKMDGMCPRCGRVGDFFADGGLCDRCGFSY